MRGWEDLSDTDIAEQFDAVLVTMRAERDRQVEQIDVLHGGIEKIRNQIEIQTSELLELQQLKREAESSRILYEYFLNRLKETSSQEGLQSASSRIISNAVVPPEPTEPSKTLYVAVSLIFGAIVGSGIALATTMVVTRFLLAEDLEKATSVPVMGQIPYVRACTRIQALEYATRNPSSALAEAIRNLRTSVLLANPDTPPRTIMVTSALPREGKTTTSFHLAHNLTGVREKVLLVEGDIRRRVFNAYVEDRGTAGLPSVIAGNASLADAVVHDETLGIDVLPSEPTDVNPADIFSS